MGRGVFLPHVPPALLHCGSVWAVHRYPWVTVSLELAEGLLEGLCGLPWWPRPSSTRLAQTDPTSAPVLSLQLGANALLFFGVNMYGVFVRILTERSQRKAFLQARNCIEDRLRLEDENEKQVSVFSTPWPFGQLCPSPS